MSVEDTFPCFPPEIIDSFVGNLPVDGTFSWIGAKDSLLACSLVSRSFSAAARSRIFSTITIRGYWTSSDRRRAVRKRSEDGLSKRIKGLAELITPDTSDLAHLIRKLDLVFEPQQVALNNKCHLNVLLRLLISRSSNLNTLSLTIHKPTPWDDISPDIVQSLTEIAQSPALVNLNLGFLANVPSDVIINNGALRSLSLSGVTFSIPTSPSDEAPVLTDLDAYLVRWGRYNFVDDHSTRDISKIMSFKMNLYTEEDASKFGRLVKAASPSLVSFELRTRNESLGFRLCRTVDLGCIPSLRKIVVHVYAEHQGLSFPIAGDVIGFFNDGMPTMLKEIEIIFHWVVAPDILHSEGFIHKEDEGLNSLAGAFFNNKHPHLKITTIGISLIVIRDGVLTEPGLRAIEQNLQAQMTSLINNGNVRVNVVAKF